MQIMKKYILSAIVVIAIVGYVLYSRIMGSSQIIVDSPATIPTTTDIVISPVASIGKYKDGTYTGENIKFLYGNMQVAAVINNGNISDINFLVYPNDNPTSVQINENAMPFWKQEAIASQQTKVNIVSRATDSGVAFTESLDSALLLAENI